MASNAKIEPVITPFFRVAFPHVFKPYSFNPEQEAKFSVVMLFDPEDQMSEDDQKKFRAMKAMVKAVAKAKWPSGIPSGIRNPFRKGEEKPSLEGYAGKIFAPATTKMKPGLVDRNNQPIIDPAEFYGGCYARASVNAFAYDRMGNRGVSFGLQNIQKVRDGDPFSGRKKAEDTFSAIDDQYDSDYDDLDLDGGPSSNGDDESWM